VDKEIFQPMLLSYTSVEKGMSSTTNTELDSGNMYNPHANITTNMCASQIHENNNLSDFQSLEPSVVFYVINQPVDPQLWDSSFCLISLFRMNEYLEGDSKNITCLLLRMAAFIKQHRLEEKTEKYMKGLNDVDYSNIMSSRLPQSKSYLKVLGIPYFIKNTNLPIFSDIIESIIKSMHTFNNIVLTSRQHIIKVLLTWQLFGLIFGTPKVAQILKC